MGFNKHSLSIQYNPQLEGYVFWSLNKIKEWNGISDSDSEVPSEWNLGFRFRPYKIPFHYCSFTKLARTNICLIYNESRAHSFYSWIFVLHFLLSFASCKTLKNKYEGTQHNTTTCLLSPWSWTLPSLVKKSYYAIIDHCNVNISLSLHVFLI